MGNVLDSFSCFFTLKLPIQTLLFVVYGTYMLSLWRAIQFQQSRHFPGSVTVKLSLSRCYLCNVISHSSKILSVASCCLFLLFATDMAHCKHIGIYDISAVHKRDEINPLIEDTYTEDRAFIRSGIGLTETPTDIPAEALTVWLYYNRISAINLESFVNFSSCVILNLAANSLTGIEPESFTGLTHLERLNLVHNEITTIAPRAFAGLTSLEELALNTNQLTTLSQDVFDPRLYTEEHDQQGVYLGLSKNPLVFDSSLCWIKEGELQGWIYKPKTNMFTANCVNFPGID